jgi:SAM-dependent methyltransferase
VFDHDLIPSVCAVCGTTGNAAELYPATLPADSFTPRIYSARRPPDRVHYRIVRCEACGLVRSDPVAAEEAVAQLYGESGFDYGDAIRDLRYTYRRYLDQACRGLFPREALLEVGCGNGFFLLEALDAGFHEVVGVEPSRVAAEGADKRVRDRIHVDVIRPGLFKEGQFDVVCMFQVLDHLPDPGLVLRECRRVLRPGGTFLSVHHDIGAFSARLLKEASPIIDVEHTYLFDASTSRQLLERNGFIVNQIGAAWNRVSLHYLMRMVPFPQGIKHGVLGALEQTRLSDLRLQLPLGNLYAVASRPE